MSLIIEDQNLQEIGRNPRRLDTANETEPGETRPEVYPSTFSQRNSLSDQFNSSPNLELRVNHNGSIV